MRHRKTYMYISFPQNRVSRSVKTVHTSLFAKICKLHKFANCINLPLAIRISKNHAFRTCTAPLQTIMLILRSIGLLDIEISRKEIISTDGRTDRQITKKKLLKLSFLYKNYSQPPPEF